jgi:outer membrane protein insertion porin family
MKRFSKGLVGLGLALSMGLQIAHAMDAFKVKDIKVEGLQRIKLGTVLNYLPFDPGHTLTEAEAPEIIRALFATGFFDNVTLSQSGNTLVIHVTERPTIGMIHSDGNKDVPKEQFEMVLKSAGLVEGEVFKRSTLSELTQALKQEYNNRGKYNTEVDVKVEPMPRNRVRVEINISEGTVARIKEIKIIGNHTYESRELLKNFELAHTHLLNIIRHKDRYDKDKLNASLEALKSFYMDRGFIRFAVESTQVSLTPDRKYVFITVKVNEGPRYTFKPYQLNGNLLLPRQKIESLITIRPGEYFSRKKVVDITSAIGLEYGKIGYGFPDINAEPTINDTDKTVMINFLINPGRRVYVRRIEFSGNSKTADYVLRREMQQQEGQILALDQIKESERKLRTLGYFKNVQVKTNPVSGTNDQVDLNYSVEEIPAGEISAGVGYGTNGIQLNAAINQRNFLGTGRTVGIDFTTNNFGQYYSVNYANPYHTMSGIGIGVNGYFQQVTPGRLGIARLSNNRMGGNVNYTIPLTARQNLHAGYGYEYLELFLPAGASTETTNYVNTYGSEFNQPKLTAGWSYGGLDQFPFPTSGMTQTVNFSFLPIITKRFTNSSGAAINPADAYFYKIDYNGRALFPITHGLIFSLQGSFGYGGNFGTNRMFPIYENYYAGGASGGQVRGFDDYSLGPRDSADRPLGGNFVFSTSAGFILPYPFSRESFRTSLFLDMGNVYAVNPVAGMGGSGSGPVRFGAGVGLDWQSFLGPLSFYLAAPLNSQCSNLPTGRHCDDAKYFGFSISTGF